MKWIVPLLMALAACRNDQPPTPSTEQSAQLNDAESMLNSLSANEEGPENRGAHQSSTSMAPSSSGPSNSSK